MKAFYLLIVSLSLVGLAPAEEEKWYDSEGNVVRVLAKERELETRKDEQLVFPEFLCWGNRRILRKSDVRGRVYYAGDCGLFTSRVSYRCGGNRFDRGCYSGGGHRFYRSTGCRGVQLILSW